MEMQAYPLFLASFALSLFCAFAFWTVGRTSPAFKGVNWLSAAYLAAAAASGLRLWRGHHSLTAFVSNTLLLLMFVLLHCALVRVLEPGGMQPWIGVAALMLQIFVAPLFGRGPVGHSHRVVLLSLLLTATIAHLCFVSLRQGLPKHGRPASVGMRAATGAMIVTLMMNAGFSIFRVYLVSRHACSGPFANCANLQIANMVIMIVCGAGIALSFFWMTAEQLRNDLEIQARVDGLTGLLNRRAFKTEFKREADRADRNQDSLSLIMLDLDHFKFVNDLYGHMAGDLMLVEVADAMRQTLRRVDLVGRLGGEEFVALLPQTDLAQARDIAERLRQDIASRRVAFGPANLTVTASLGVVTWRRDEFQDLLRLADAGMYLAKEAGRNRVEVVAS